MKNKTGMQKSEAVLLHLLDVHKYKGRMVHLSDVRTKANICALCDFSATFLTQCRWVKSV